MKKILLFLIGLFFVSVQAFADTRATALLLHNGQGKSFDADQLQTAINEAVAGDTICLSEGTFKAGEKDTLLIDKDIAIIGAGGEVTIIGGNVIIALDGNQIVKRHILDAIRITESVTISKSIRGVYVRKCWISKELRTDESIEVYDMQIDRCYINNFFSAPTIKSATLINTILFKHGGNNTSAAYKSFVEGHDIYFINCSICYIDGFCKLAATYKNCIISFVTSPGQYIKNCYFYKTLFGTNTGNAATTYIKSDYNVFIDCYQANYTTTIANAKSNFPTFNITKEQLTERGFLGSDGTIIGAEGGVTPYSLEAEGISVKESVLRVDPETRKLNVTLKVASE